MDGDFIQVSKKAASNDYVIRIYFAEIDGEVNITLTEEALVRFLNESVKLINQNSGKYTLRVPDDISHLVDEYGVNQIYRIKSKMQRKRVTKEVAEVFIFIPDAFVEMHNAEQLTNAAGDFMESLGFELEAEDEPVLGSFLKRLKFIFSKTVGAEDLESLYNKGKKALELKHVDLPTAEQTEKLANAAEKLIASLKEVNEGVVRCGALLILKKQVNGETKIIIQQLSTEMILLLEKNPNLLFSPNTMYELLTGDVPGAINGDDSKDQIRIA